MLLTVGAATTIYCACAPNIVPGGYYSDCKEEKVQVHAKAHGVEYAQKLWDASMRMTGVANPVV